MRYELRAKYEVLLFSSVHSKVIKQDIARNCLNGALENSCLPKVALSFVYQVASLKVEGLSYPDDVTGVTVENY